MTTGLSNTFGNYENNILDCIRQDDHTHAFLGTLPIVNDSRRGAVDATGFIAIHESGAARLRFLFTHGVPPVRDYDGYLAQMCDLTEARDLSARTATRDAVATWRSQAPARSSRALTGTEATLRLAPVTGEWRKSLRWLEPLTPTLAEATEVPRPDRGSRTVPSCQDEAAVAARMAAAFETVFGMHQHTRTVPLAKLDRVEVERVQEVRRITVDATFLPVRGTRP